MRWQTERYIIMPKYLSIYLSIYLPNLSINQSIYLQYLSIYLSISLSHLLWWEAWIRTWNVATCNFDNNLSCTNPSRPWKNRIYINIHIIYIIYIYIYRERERERGRYQILINRWIDRKIELTCSIKLQHSQSACNAPARVAEAGPSKFARLAEGCTRRDQPQCQCTDAKSFEFTDRFTFGYWADWCPSPMIRIIAPASQYRSLKWQQFASTGVCCNDAQEQCWDVNKLPFAGVPAKARPGLWNLAGISTCFSDGNMVLSTPWILPSGLLGFGPSQKLCKWSDIQPLRRRDHI